MSESGSAHASSDANSPTVLGDSPSQPSTTDISALPFIEGFEVLGRFGQGGMGNLTFRPKTNEIFAATFGKVFEVNQGTDSSPVTPMPADLVFTPDGKGFFALGREMQNELHLIDTETYHVLQTFSGHEAALSDVIITSDGSRLATFAGDKTVKLWDTASGQETLSISPGDFIKAIAFTPDDRQLVVGLYAGEIRFYDSSSGYQSVPE
jgi:WD40 repeat protein